MNRSRFVLGILLLTPLFVPGFVLAQERETEPPPRMIGSIPPVGVSLPDFQWETLTGESFSPEHLRDHRTVMVLWSPTCSGSKRVVRELPELLDIVNNAGAQLLIVNTDSSRVEARQALSDAIPDSQVVFAREISRVLTNPAAYEGEEGPILKAVMVPAVVLIDPQGIVRSSSLWDGPLGVSAKLERLSGGGVIDTSNREQTSNSASHFR